MAIGEMVLSAALQVLFDRLATREAISFFQRSEFDESLVHKLKILMSAAENLILGAEIKHMTDPVVKPWLDELKHWFYQGEDVIDQIATEALRCSIEMESQSFATKVRNWSLTFSTSSSFINTVTQNIKKIICMLESMLDRKDDLGLSKLPEGRTPQRIPTTCLISDKVYGRDMEKEQLFKFLLSEEVETNRIRVVAIVGVGGLGKTTLAKMVYHDERVQKNFDHKAWVCVSEKFDIYMVTRLIIDVISGQPYSGSEDLNSLQIELSRKLRDKKLFLVLDDLWNEESDVWEVVQAPLLVAAIGSRIMVTTRNKKVASAMRSEYVFRLNTLSDEDAWSLFSRHAFESGKQMANPSLEPIGREIVQKCKGLPLAIKTLGSLLCCTSVEEWKEILESNFWDLCNTKGNVIPALWLSYYYLPPHLKRCFSYCAIFPKDHRIDCKQLMLFWMAENFVLPTENKRPEDVAVEYLLQLLSRSLLEPANKSCVVMHDLMHDLAEGISGSFLAAGKHEGTLKEQERIRNFSYYGDDYDTITKFQFIGKTKFLRTLFRQNFDPGNFHPDGGSHLTNKVLDDIIPRLYCLRVLSLPGYQNLLLPESIACLNLLRYLDISHSNVNQLPASMTTLYNLQTLVLTNCLYLKKLPDNMWKMRSLFHLDIRGATSLSHMPEEMSKLKNLQFLTDFVVGKDTGSSMEELRKLQGIRGTFALRRLQNICVMNDASVFYLQERTLIYDLHLEFDAEESNDSEKARKVLQILKPPSGLKKLTIKGYAGTRFPNWLNPGCALYINMGFLCLSGCRYCYSLPPLGQLPSLKILEIEGMDSIIRVGQEFYGHYNPFPALVVLSFKKMGEWKVWSNLDAEGGAVCFTHLKKLSLLNCPKLEGDLPLHAPSLAHLKIDACVRLQYDSFRFLQQMASVFVKDPDICPCPRAEWTKALNLTSIIKLSLVGLLHLVELPAQLALLPSLRDLEIFGCGSLKSLSNVVLPRLLVKLKIQYCNVLEFPPKRMTSLANLHSLIISACPILKWGSGDSLPTSLSYLEIGGGESWEFFIPIERMQKYTRLEYLGLHMASGHLVSFPLGIFPNLGRLYLAGCKGLEKVYIPKGIEDKRVTSLCKIFISGCPKLETIGIETRTGEATVLPAPNLKELSIIGCERVRPVIIETEEEVLLPKLETLKIDKSTKIKSEWPLNLKRRLLRFSRLRELMIEGEEVECFPVTNDSWGPLPASLRTLIIRNFPNLRRLDGKALQTLTCLTELSIQECPKLESLAEESLPPSLGSLLIRECPIVEERYKPQKGKAWSKICHIPEVCFL